MSRNEAWLQITAGQGPAECGWAVLRVLEEIRKEAEAAGIDVSVCEVQPGPQPDTAMSVLLSVSSAQMMDAFLASWTGTVQWIARSPFRPAHKRKNWFVGIEAVQPVTPLVLNPRDVVVETMRASGPGGQHVNRTESAIRVTHQRTGLQAVASEERSQHRNRALAMARLARKLADQEQSQRSQVAGQRWQAHHSLERGNPVRILRDSAGQ